MHGGRSARRGGSPPLDAVHAQGAPLSMPCKEQKLGLGPASNHFWLLAGEDCSGEELAADSYSCNSIDISRYFHLTAPMDTGINECINRKLCRIRQINHQSKNDIENYVKSFFLKN